MFDIGFTELVVIAVVALVVIGPERLPTVARTLGALFGRLNRYVSDVKADVAREMRLEEMKKLRAEVEQQAMGIEQQVVGELEATRQTITSPLDDTERSMAEVIQETGHMVEETQQQVVSLDLQPTAGTEPALADAGAVESVVQAPAVLPAAESVVRASPNTESVSKA